MFTVLDDNTVIPSYLGVSNRGTSEAADDQLQNFILRQGEVKRVVHPDDPKSYSKKEIEYEVNVEHRDGVGVTTTTLYRGVTANSVFGGSGDSVEAVYRADTTGAKGPGNGAQVLLLCVSGDQQKAVILGAKRTKKSTDKTYHATFEFNGVKLNINEDGELEILRKGATEASGAVKEQYQEEGGAYVRLTKDGSVLVSAPGGEQFIKIDHRQKEVNARADKKLVVSVAGQTEITSDGNTFIEATHGGIQLTSQDGTTIGDATNAMMLGDAYRNAESVSNNTLATSLQTAGSAAMAAGASLQVAAALNAIPMVGGLLAMPALIAAASAMLTIGGALNAGAAGIQQFEGGAFNYLSQKNRND